MSTIRRMLRNPWRKSSQESLGLGQAPGERHYRAYVGPPADYDLVAAMTFNLLTTLGLRQHHAVLDVGCGSLRIGRLLIPYLNVGNYSGIEPNGWLVEEGIQRETGRDQIRIKKPNLICGDSADALPRGASYDFIVAQSIFSHCGPDLIERWLTGVSSRMPATGALVATFLIGEEDCRDSGWIYPGCVHYRLETMEGLARKAGLGCFPLDWNHPRQTWALFGKPDFDLAWIRDRGLSWNSRYAPTTAPR